jgi:hypothetical protein
VPTETVPTNERVGSEVVPEIVRSRDEELRELALRQLENVRKFKLYVSVYVVSMLVLTPIWVLTEYLKEDSWPKHLSSRSRYPGDWDPWIIWVALTGAVLVGLAGLRAYRRRPQTEAEIEREIERLRSTG